MCNAMHLCETLWLLQGWRSVEAVYFRSICIIFLIHSQPFSSHLLACIGVRILESAAVSLHYLHLHQVCWESTWPSEPSWTITWRLKLSHTHGPPYLFSGNLMALNAMPDTLETPYFISGTAMTLYLICDTAKNHNSSNILTDCLKVRTAQALWPPYIILDGMMTLDLASTLTWLQLLVQARI